MLKKNVIAPEIRNIYINNELQTYRAEYTLLFEYLYTYLLTYVLTFYM